MWWIDYENENFIIDDTKLTELKKTGLPNEFLEKVKQMKGNYNSIDKYIDKRREVFGENHRDIVTKYLTQKNLSLSRKETSGYLAYRADGYLGNYLIIDPKNKIVALRMISHNSYKKDSDGFNNFKSFILNITK